MTIKKFMLALLLPAIGLVALYTFTQMLRGASLDAAMQFGFEWAVITLGIYYAVRATYRYRNKACKIKNNS